VSASTSSSERGTRLWQGGLHIDLRFALLTACLLAASFALSSIPDVDGWNGPLITAFFNVMHVPLFGAVAFCCYKTLAKGRELSMPAIALAFVASVVYAVVDEWHQSFVAGRNASLSDVIVDVIGAGLMLLVIGWWSLLRARRSRTPAESES
jgi:VanZ family protein